MSKVSHIDLLVYMVVECCSFMKTKGLRIRNKILFFLVKLTRYDGKHDSIEALVLAQCFNCYCNWSRQIPFFLNKRNYAIYKAATLSIRSILQTNHSFQQNSHLDITIAKIKQPHRDGNETISSSLRVIRFSLHLEIRSSVRYFEFYVQKRYRCIMFPMMTHSARLSEPIAAFVPLSETSSGL